LRESRTRKARVNKETREPGLEKAARGSDTLIIGVGNPQRGDDGVGHFIAGKLKQRRLPKSRVQVHWGDGISLMETWENAQTVILLDAVRSGAPPGKIFHFDAIRQSIPRGFFNCSTHSFSVAEAVELAKTLKKLPPRLLIYGIEGQRFNAGIGLSSEVEIAAERVIERLTRDICSPLLEDSDTPKNSA
jgi:hydrogenase maturation protease